MLYLANILIRMMYSINPTPTEISLDLAKRIQALRKKLKYSQAELADRSGVSLGSLKRFERTGKISLESLLKLAHLLGRLKEFKELFLIDDELENVKRLFSDK